MTLQYSNYANGFYILLISYDINGMRDLPE